MNPPKTHGQHGFSAAELEAAKLPVEAEQLASTIVAAQLRALFADANGECAPAECFEKLGPLYQRWLGATLRYLAQQGRLDIDAATQRHRFVTMASVDALWQRWDAAKPAWHDNANHRAYLTLIEACLRSLPEILTDAVPATDVMFPESSMHMVEGIYKHNLVADHFNRVLGESLRAALAAKVARGERGIRLLEIGAGTGGTTAALLPMLREFGDAIEEYCYTDLSKAFLLHAEDVYQPQFPAIRTAIFNVGKPLAGQAVPANSYDVVIATNVLHATSNMRETMRNAKAALKRNGLLLVNEISDWSWYTHFTFGLLEGWWLYEDENLRLPGSPGLSPAQWESLLKAERYFDIGFPAKDQHGLGQQIIVASSDGVVRQRLVAHALPPKPPARAMAAAAPVAVAPAAVSVPSAPTQSSIPANAAVTDDAALRQASIALFRDVIAGALKMDAREIEPHAALESYGLDSILVVQLTTHFRKLFPSVRSTLFFEVKSIDGLVRHFLDNDRETLVAVLAAKGQMPVAAASSARPAAPVAPATLSPGSEQTERRRFAPRKAVAPAPAPVPLPLPVPAPAVAAEGLNVFDVAVIGFSGRFPQAQDMEQFWENLSSGRNCVTEIPADRWNWQDYYDPEKGKAGTSYTRWGGFLAEIDKFDPLFFKIAPKEAKRLDPQERLFLETSYHAIEDSGHTPATLAPNGKVGVFVGVMNSRYTVQPLYYSIANRVSFLFNFNGPSFAVDSACSSSLTAIHLALESLYGGMCDTAIAGGVSLIVDPQHMLELTAVGMLSEGSQCRSFGRNADGFIDAEGVGAVILKPLSHALRDGDNIHAVIKGSALNAGGRTHGYSVPNPVAQADVVSSALARANVDAADVGYIEAHGTGTALGDPIEIAGLTKAFAASRRTAADGSAERQYCAIGSLKSNMGHCESAAGIAALGKVLLQLKHRQLVPTLHSDEVNDEIDFSKTPFHLQRTLAPWRRRVVSDAAGMREIPLIAGISSFGAGGANAHVVVQERPEPESDAAYRQAFDGDRACIVPLSARTSDQLQQKIRQLDAFLSRNGSGVNLSELVYTLQVGREAMDERLALIAGSIDDLQRQLRALATGQRAGRDTYRGSTRQEKEFIAACRADPGFSQRCDAWIAQRDDAKLAEHWARGVDLDWSRLYAPLRPKRISLPLYPFARDRHWMEPQRSGAAAQAHAAAHPLLQRNTSTLRYPAYAAGFKGDESFLVQGAAGQRQLPALLCIEMARAAVAAAYPEQAQTRDLRIDDMVSADPIVIDAGCELQIALLPDSDEALRFEIYSTRDGQENIHCQGRAQFEPQARPAHLDVAAIAARLSRGEAADAFHAHLGGIGPRVVQRAVLSGREIVLEFSTEASAPEPWGLSPGMLQALTQGAARLLGDLGRLPSSAVEWQLRELRTLQVHARCDQRGYLILRCSDAPGADRSESEWEVEAFDALGQPSFHATGLRLQGASDHDVVVSSASAPTTVAQATLQLPTPVEIKPPVETRQRIEFLPTVLPAVALSPVPDAVATKPNTIALRAIAPSVLGDAGDSSDAKRVARPTISLSAPGAASAADAQSSCVSIHDHGDGVLSIAIERNMLDGAALDHLRQALQAVQLRTDAKALLITGSETDFLHGDRPAIDQAASAGLYRAVLDLPIPTIAVMQGDASGAGFLLGAICDFMICSRESRYGFSDPQSGVHATPVESDFFAARFGAALANDLLYIGGAQDGRSMSAKGWTFPIADRAQALSTALTLARTLAEKPGQALRLLKTHLASAWQQHVAGFGTTGFGATGSSTQEPDATTQPQRPTLSLDAWVAREGIAVEMLSASVVSLRLFGSGADPSALLRNLRAALDDLAQSSGYAALVIRSEHDGFLPPIDTDGESELTALQAALSSFPVPVITAFEHDADGPGWLLGLSGDACVHLDSGRYSTEALWRHPTLLQQATLRFDRRFGERLAKRILFDTAAVSGAELVACAGIVATGGASEVLAKALAIAASFPLRSPTVFQQWRMREAAARADGQAAAGLPAAGDAAAGKRPASTFVSASSAIETEVHDNGVFVVRMVDRQAKNMFSPEIIQGLEDVFAHIEASDDHRVVVLCGYDTYFACGGTRESLLAIQQGTAKFTDAKIYQLPMSCKLPVIAAMQGHAIGGGWALGMFADICMFSAESRYISPYMQYGFTPGAGSTLIFPATLGVDLAKESLFTATEYSGSELKAKGLSHRCLARSELMPQALALADALATRGREDLIALKRHFGARWLAVLDETYDRELAMHDQSFVGQQHAMQGVMAHFLTGDQPAAVATVEPAAQASSAPAAVPSPAMPSSTTVDAAAVAEDLKSLLAAELQMEIGDVDEDAQFVDIGLDSITGVTWVRKINAKYLTKIEATKVYSHPTLRQFCEFVHERVSAQASTQAADRPRVQVAPQTVPAAQPQVPASAAVEPVVAAAPAEAGRDLLRELKSLLAQELHMPEEDIDEDRQFVELGLDSITGVTWVRKINAKYLTKIEATKVYSHPTLVEFARFIGASLPAQAGSPSAPRREQAPVVHVQRPVAAVARTGATQRRKLISWRTRHRGSPRLGTDAIAVIGIAGQFPHAKNLDEFWRNIAGGKDCIDQVPSKRWDINAYFNEDISVSGTTNSRWMGALEDCDAFDPLFFNISPTEAESMDPQQRLLLQTCWHAIENAAINPRTLSGSRCGVFVGCGATDYHQRSREHRYSTQGFTGAAMSILAARISYFLNLQGPSIAIDTACSSSLVAIANACDSLASHDCAIALAGGVAVMAGPMMHIKTAQSGMLSPDGRCFAFDHRANGFVPGEGVGVVMLKRLADAERDGDIIHATIRGWGINQDGKTNGITAPNPVSQTRLMRSIYDKFGIDPEDIQLIEAHGTGTPLGDPIEVEGLNNAFRHYTQKAEYCVLGSVKSNVGHCLYAAGVAGVLKLVLALKHRQLPPAANFERLNEHLDLADSPFVINTALKPWPVNAKGGRLGVVSSFGFSGTNAHLVLEAGPELSSETKRHAPSTPAVMVPLSAKSREQLREEAGELADFIVRNEASLSLSDVAYTLQVGREAMDERCATVVSSMRELVERLRAFAAGETSRDMHVGSTSSRSNKLAFIGQDGDLRDALIDTCLRDGKLGKLAELWVDGLDLAWEQLYRHAPSADQPRRRIELPLYPFAKERYWLEDDMSATAGNVPGAAPVIHPLLHVNASTLMQQRYRTTFDGSESFLRDHRVRLADGRIEHVLPGVAYLEMARAAIADALPERAVSQQLVLNNVAWWRPVIVNGRTTVAIDLGVDETGTIMFEIVSEIFSENGGERVLHCQGEAEFIGADAPMVDTAAFASVLNGEGWRAADIYAAFTQVGLHYGPTHRGIDKICRDDGTVVAKVSLPSCASDSDAYWLHPSVMDSALQACIGFLPSLQALPKEPSVPFTLQSMTIHGQCPPEAIVVLTPMRSPIKGAATETCNVSIHAPDGRLCVAIRGFAWRVVEARKAVSSEAPCFVIPSDETPMFDEAFYQELLESISNNEMSAEEAVDLGLLS
ncbi:MAG: methyltransferase [Lysobacter sp.]|nr:methyltransferase [Lysobacter sp.]